MRVVHPQILTAWRLDDGEAVYRGAGGWVRALEDATPFTGIEAAKAALEAAEADVAARVIVGPYLFDAAVERGVIRPLSARELIRAKGPTVRLDLGKQAAYLPARG
ncbi:MAG TPA: DUF2849 domain-containing protein [Micropepsaceae bacterium]|nr:DUF2849 domain-containing protein [Micropepsaceae bacterium]